MCTELRLTFIGDVQSDYVFDMLYILLKSIETILKSTHILAYLSVF